LNPVIGALVPPSPWEGLLVGVSAKAVSILHADGALVSVIGDTSWMEARALAHPAGFKAFAAAAARVTGDHEVRVSLKWDGRLLLCHAEGKVDAPFDMLDFTGAVLWNPRMETVPSAYRGGTRFLDALAVNTVIGIINQVIADARARGRPVEGIHAAGAWRTMFAKLAAEADFPANLVGFGPGTTPAGDDWLAGCLAALDLTAGAGPAGTLAVRVRAALAGRLERTTAAGRALLLGAIAGLPPEYLWELSRAALGGIEDGNGRGRITECVGRALEHGATSGEDALAGFIAGLRVSIQGNDPEAENSGLRCTED
jgi:hypothetical protein